MAEEKKTSSEEQKNKKITTEEIMAMAKQADQLKAMGDEDILKRIEEAAEKASDGDINVLLQGMQDIIDSDNAEKNGAGKQAK